MEAKITYDQRTMNNLIGASDKVTYAIARRMIDHVGELHATAYRTGEMERSMFSHGVGQDALGYYIGNFTSYAKEVYSWKDANWTNKNTRPQWFDSVWKEYGELIKVEVLSKYLGS